MHFFAVRLDDRLKQQETLINGNYLTCLLVFTIVTSLNKSFSSLQRQFKRIHCCDIVSALYSLEDDWRDIVENSSQLSEKQQQQQTALWELTQTEVAYIKTLKVVTDVSVVSNTFHLANGFTAVEWISLIYSVRFDQIDQADDILIQG